MGIPTKKKEQLSFGAFRRDLARHIAQIYCRSHRAQEIWPDLSCIGKSRTVAVIR
ncbi:hypothetical protein HYC85_020530 [Camellia sinensis]|uniref:Uncharacterized protein n=1 Tax=Camellia sinensis TaxID=4442 RepID=A0A7J7GTX1_CAMSI|nr:hypothetical protein HYC85_020530 [Camellia sinensis]